MVTIHRPLTKFEDILERGTEGECCGPLQYTSTSQAYNGVLILATRYLQPGPDTEYVQNCPIDWSKCPMEDGHHQAALPKRWQVMGKGLLLNYFKWREIKNKELMAIKKAKRDACDGKHISQGYVCDTCSHIHFAECHTGETGWGP